jgi:uncharacterized membrane protein YkvA (DUF1232 family)
MVVDGELDRNSPAVEIVMKDYEPLDQKAALSLMGLSEAALITNAGESQSDGVLRGLNTIGSTPDNQAFVSQNNDRLGTFKKIGSEWAERVQVLVEVTRSKKFSPIDKFVAFGALAYLLTTFDLIPDTIPVFGLLDDFAVLGYAITYYVNRSAQIDSPKK